MRIVHVAIRFPPAEGGGEQVVYNLAKQQVKMENEVYVITTNLMKEVPREVDKTLPTKEVMNDINVIRMKTYPTGLPVWGYGSIFFGLKKLLNEIKPDIVHTHSYGYFHSDVLARLRKKSEWKLVMTSHGFTPGRGIFRYVKKIYDKSIGKRTVKNIEAGIAISKKDKEIFERLGAKNIYIIPNGIELSKFEGLPDKNVFRNKYNVKGKMILNVSRLSRIKGHAFLIEAFSRIVKEFPDTTLVIVGEDWGELMHLKKLVKRLNLGDRVIFTGKIPEKYLLGAYSSADVFVLCSIEEPFGIVLLEAMASSVPIVSTNRGGPPEVIVECGLLVEPNPIAIYDGICKLLREASLRNKFIESGKKRVLEFTWKKTAEKNMKVYRETLNL
ncbi:MAG: glycosyltransferase family 4 protein [Nanoarchaeota archaeon]|nr:glycosyltransferase family 4 protein [Nanoarchaeota archaeon]